MRIIAVDPGPVSSGIIVLDPHAPLGSQIVQHAHWLNEMLLMWLTPPRFHTDEVLVIEMMESFGMPVGTEVFRTVWWAGRFHQAWAGVGEELTRKAVKLHLCGSARAKDGNVTQAIRDRFGATKLAAVGRKAAPGPLYGVKGHEYAALGVALTWWDTRLGRPTPTRRDIGDEETGTPWHP